MNKPIRKRDFDAHPVLEVRIITGTLENPAPTGDRIIDWRDSDHRHWLTKHLHWAMLNGHAVALIPPSA